MALPGVAALDRSDFTQYWSFTSAVAQRLFGDVFGAKNVEVEGFGNVYAATCFLQGMALEEVETAMLDPKDWQYAILVTVRARRAESPR